MSQQEKFGSCLKKKRFVVNQVSMMLQIFDILLKWWEHREAYEGY